MENKQLLGKKSWFAYIKSFIWSIVLSVIAILIITLIFGIFNKFTTLSSSLVFDRIIPIGFILFIIYKLWDISSYLLYYDEEGVWVFSGVLPWTKGVRGVKWRDLDSANYKISAISWFTNSYDVIINHRYTKENEIYLSDMWEGKKMVSIINDKHNRLIVNSEIA